MLTVNYGPGKWFKGPLLESDWLVTQNVCKIGPKTDGKKLKCKGVPNKWKNKNFLKKLKIKFWPQKLM